MVFNVIQVYDIKDCRLHESIGFLQFYDGCNIVIYRQIRQVFQSLEM